MALKLISRNNVGVMATLVLVILLSQSRCFAFLTETCLGRMFLLGILIVTTISNKIFGLLAVLFIIIAFNQNDSNVVQSYNFYEGFEVDSKKNVEQTEEEDAAKQTEEEDAAKQTEKASSLSDLKNKINNLIDTSLEESNDSSEQFIISSSSSSAAREGFCMSDRELNILRGKQSNAVPVFNKSREQTNEVDPSDKSFFSSDYALF